MSWRRPCKTSCTSAGTNTSAEGGRRSSRDATRQVNNCVVWSIGNLFGILMLNIIGDPFFPNVLKIVLGDNLKD